MLGDLPLMLYAADAEALRREILVRDARRSARQQANVALLTREMERRSRREIDAHLALLRREQEALSRSFAATLRQSFLTFTGGFGVLLLVLLGAGLHHVVIRPIRELRAATRSVAAGHLPPRVAPPRPVELHDEVDALAAGFAAMIEQLGASRAEVESKTRQLEALNADLQEEVGRQSRQLVHAAKMASIGTLAGGVAHEFNNLIGGIQGCAREALACQTIGAGAREPLEIILRATHRAAHITQQLRQFAHPHIEARREVSVARLLHEVLELSAPQARRQGVTVQRDIDGDPLSVLGDPGGLHQVFLNLVTNALQAMPGGGQLTAAAHGFADRVVVTIADTGVGIAHDDLDHVFEPFFTRKGDAEDPGLRGSGLGLSVSYGIVEAHAGRLEVRSEPGAGTLFTTTLPTRPPVAGTKP
jgi:two-component system NtrC family sensor kinase